MASGKCGGFEPRVFVLSICAPVIAFHAMRSGVGGIEGEVSSYVHIWVVDGRFFGMMILRWVDLASPLSGFRFRFRFDAEFSRKLFWVGGGLVVYIHIHIGSIVSVINSAGGSVLASPLALHKRCSAEVFDYGAINMYVNALMPLLRDRERSST